MKALLFCLLPVLSFGQSNSVSIGAMSHQKALAVGGFANYTHRGGGAFVGMGIEAFAIRSATPFFGLTGEYGRYLFDGEKGPFLYLQAGAGGQACGDYGAFAGAGAGMDWRRLTLTLTYRGTAIKQVNEDQSESPSVNGWYLHVGFNLFRQ